MTDTSFSVTVQMGISYEPGALQATTKELWDGLLRKVSLAFADQVSFEVMFAIRTDFLFKWCSILLDISRFPSGLAE